MYFDRTWIVSNVCMKGERSLKTTDELGCNKAEVRSQPDAGGSATATHSPKIATVPVPNRICSLVDSTHRSSPNQYFHDIVWQCHSQQTLVYNSCAACLSLVKLRIHIVVIQDVLTI